jgi:hypothetical protein
MTTLPKLVTVTPALAGRTPAPLGVAVMVAEPGTPPVTGTGTLVAPCTMVTEEGTVATALLLEIRVIVTVDGAAVERLRVKFCVPPVPRVRAVGAKVRDDATVTGAVSPVSPGALAEILATPKPTPVTVAGVTGSVAPAGIVIEGRTVTFDVSLLVRVTVTPPIGAAVASVT